MSLYVDPEFGGTQPPAEVVGGRFTRNYATSGGGAIDTLQDVAVRDAIFSKNQTLGTGRYSAGGGAVLVDEGTTAVIAGSVFLRNAADTDTAAVLELLGSGTGDGDLRFVDDRLVDGGAVTSALFTDLTVRGSKFRRNAAVGDGGAVRSGYLATLRNVRMFSNTAGGDGGAVVAINRGVTAEGGRYAMNVAGGGGAFYASSAPLALSDLVLNRNAAGAGGGGAVAAGGGGSFDVVTLSGLFLAANSTARGGDGGAVRVVDNDVEIDDCNFDRNRAAGNGGGLAVEDARATFRDSALRRGRADRGGAAFVGDGADLRLEDAVFVDNDPNDFAGPGRVRRD